MESNVQVSPEYLCGVLFSASNAKVGNPALDYKRLPLAASFQRHPPSPECQLFTEGGVPSLYFLGPPPRPAQLLYSGKPVLCPQIPRLGVKTDSKPRGGSTVFTPAQPFNYESTCRVCFFF